MWDDEEEVSREATPNRKGAEPGVGLGIYAARKRDMTKWSLFLALPVAAGVAFISPVASLALSIGALCGIVNARISMAGNEQLLDHQRVIIFVFSTILRFALFGIVPLALATHGPAWTIGPYLLGFLSPLLIYIVLSSRRANGPA